MAAAPASLTAAASIPRSGVSIAGPSGSSSSVRAQSIRSEGSSSARHSLTIASVSSDAARISGEVTSITAARATSASEALNEPLVVDSAGFVGATSTIDSSVWTEPSATLLVPATGSSDGLGPGKVAGIAIGCVVVGCVAGLIAACALLRRNSQYVNVATAVVAHDESRDSAIEATAQVISSSNGNRNNDMNRMNGIQLNHFLLEATPDRDIAQEVQSLGELIHQHVQNYYHTKPVLANTESLSAALSDLGFSSATKSIGSHIPAQSMAILCRDASTRSVGLRHVIMRAAFSSIDFELQYGSNNLNRIADASGPLPCLLPQPMVPFLRAMAPHENEAGGGKTLDEATAMTVALREWRRLSAFLLHPERSLRTALPVQEAAAAVQAQELARRLNVFLGHFVETTAGAAQRQERHLQAVIVECATLGHVLLSHPSDWRVVVDDDTSSSSSSSRRAVVVEAGLDRLSDRDGPRYRRPQRVVEPVVVYCNV
ncbi:hypothetical protein E4U55_003577 [Claviceps digitariae]|nr:hypothetical protein E4U55_003577 [Claviceps digitariae]